jgi:hypothetical protein
MTNGNGNGAGALPTAEPDRAAHILTAVLLVAAVVAALILKNNHPHAVFEAKANFTLFAGFYVIAQVVERILEVVSPFFPFWQVDANTKKADRGLILLGLGTFAGTILSGSLGLYFLTAVGMKPALWVDMIVTGLVISGGTKSLHEFINLIQKPANPPGTPTNG